MISYRRHPQHDIETYTIKMIKNTKIAMITKKRKMILPTYYVRFIMKGIRKKMAKRSLPNHEFVRPEARESDGNGVGT